MEVLTLMIRRKVENDEDFEYHWRCEEVGMTHLCFADNLLLFCHGDEYSVSVLNDALFEFGIVFGLIPNMSKGTIYFSNVKKSTNDAISDVIPFQVGVLLVRYLGAPLISSYLLRKDCLVLIDKVKNRLMRNFLWCQEEFKRGKAKVNWGDVWKPKSKGGQGIKSLRTWNKALMAKHIWNIVNDKDFICVRWIKAVKLRSGE
ncbi:uncharacterized protein [Rutidosis leptorrhynchoides]|uniref:uncharacterized protein n=1 Tax=Rutidosis leptorrhynchoides TaxID=125765 RepID=UPI003A998269